ncbi:NADH:flavin oxidoreductase [Paenibacillus eucommiae]|uniref:2,4-dienoyl-CoA reductase-like NADH-dependent reductase (Old Yellow Enzyme family) n=1 Tax=Paenibacillus eucommiae TaxID=1355755 RepID=A0ABS4IQE3_9BACL|nr:NADH:flavin oxidoreductase [Paenibacillus eucommiae]MBP1989790.1 2,4-dienoyl-CoA reductase-like NADH-dependent reductase (Old Yellow Enzyme family) [Paenibacillus eucommiae]
MNNNNIQGLFQPFSTGNLTLANRIVMAPMTRCFSPDGVPGADVAAYYRRRAENGVGLIITEGTAINHPAAVNNSAIPLFHGEKSLNGWANVLAEVHEAGGRIIPQLWHVGTTRVKGDYPNPEAMPVGPSGLNSSREQVAEPLSEAEISAIIDAYAEAAADAKRIGFDGIEIHGAHGYLIDQFFWEKTNQRTDRYGGSLIARTQFAVEIIKACRQAVGDEFPIVFRYSQWKVGEYTTKLAETPEQLAQFLEPLSAAGVDIFHCSTREFWEPEFEGSPLNLAGWTKKITGKPTITVGSVGLNSQNADLAREQAESDQADIEEVVKRLENEEFDLVAIGRALLADPAWAAKMHDNRTNEIIPFTPKSTATLS